MSCNNGNNNNNQNNGNYASQMCTDLYKDAYKCESKLKGNEYKDESSCELIHDIIPRMSGAMKRSFSASKFFAWTFAVVIGIMGWYIYR